MPVIDRLMIQDAEELLRTLCVALAELHVYGPGHPRFRQAVDASAATLRQLTSHPGSPRSMSIAMDREQVEFQGVPLMNIGAQSERLRKAFGDKDIAGVQLEADADSDDLAAMCEAIAGWSRPRAKGDAAEDVDDAAADAGAVQRRFRFVKRFSRDASSTSEAPSVEESPPELVIPELRLSESTFRSVLTTYRSLISNVNAGRVFDYDVLRRTADHVVTVFGHAERSILPAVHPSYFDDFTFHHSSNVCLIATTIASAITPDAELLRRISLAALVHDVGKCRVPAEILHKPEKLTRAEFEVLKSHPCDGARILMGIREIDPMCVAVAYTHHINSGISSYPPTRKPLPINWVTELIAVIDVYEALVSIRPYKKGMSSRTAFEIMFSMPGLKDRHAYIKLLYDRIGPYPTGTIVELSTGERALVIEQNSDALFFPKLRVLTDPDRNSIDRPWEIDMSTRPRAAGTDYPLVIARTVLPESQEDDPLQSDVRPEPENILGEPLNDDGALMTREG